MSIFGFRRRKDVVALAAFPKSGVTYLSSLLFHSLFPNDVHNASDIERSYIVDSHINDVQSCRKAFGMRFVKTHSSYGANPDLDRRTWKAIHLVRDPIDVMHSAFDFRRLLDPDDGAAYSQFVDDWISSGGAGFDIAGSWEDHGRSWAHQKDVPVLVVKYADLVDHSQQQLGRIFDFLEFNIGKKHVETAVASSTMTAMRAREEAEFAQKKKGVFFSELVASGMDKGARFVNKARRNSIETLEGPQKEAAENRFGPLIRELL